MSPKTDYMFVLDGSWVRLREALPTAVLCGILLGGVASAAGWLVATPIAFAVTLLGLFPSRGVFPSVVRLAIESHERQGWVLPKAIKCPVSGVTAALLLAVAAATEWFGVAMLVLVPAAVLWNTARHAGTRKAWKAGYDCLFTYLCYPDPKYNIVGGWFAYWFPKVSRPRRVIRFAGLFVAAGAVVGLKVMEWRDGRGPVDISQAAALTAWVVLLPFTVIALLASPGVQILQLRRDALDAPTEWDRVTELVRQSTYEKDGLRLADHVFMGYLQSPHSDYWHPHKTIPTGMIDAPRPMLVHRSVIEGGHGQVCGRTQSGKSAISMVGLATQLIRGALHTTALAAVAGGATGLPPPTPRFTPILCVDLKGDLASFNKIRTECLKRGQPFHAFSLEHGMETSYFNAVAEFDTLGRPAIELAEAVANALSLFWGSEYGRAYFSAQHRDLLLDASHSYPRATTWGELYQRLLQKVDRDKHRDVFELISKARVLAEYPQLGKPPPGADVIRMRQVIEQGHCVYLWLPVHVASMSVRDVGKLAAYAFLGAARDAMKTGHKVKAYLMVDEFQCLTGDNMAVVLQQAAATGVSIVMANQAPSDLDMDSSHDLSSVVRTNVSWSCFHTINDADEMDRWIRASGETLTYLASYGNSWSSGSSSSGSSSSTSVSVNWSPVVHHRVNDDLLRQVNCTEGGAMVLIDADRRGGVRLYGVPHRLWMPWPVSRDEYRTLDSTPWPQAKPVASAPQPAVTTKPHAQVALDALDEFAKLDALFDSLRGQRAGGASQNPAKASPKAGSFPIAAAPSATSTRPEAKHRSLRDIGTASSSGPPESK